MIISSDSIQKCIGRTRRWQAYKHMTGEREEAKWNPPFLQVKVNAKLGEDAGQGHRRPTTHHSKQVPADLRTEQLRGKMLARSNRT